MPESLPTHTSTTPLPSPQARHQREGELARTGGATWLAHALLASRADTLKSFEAIGRTLPQWQVPKRADLNPPLWELGHIGWFQSHWLGRNPERSLGAKADPSAPRLPSLVDQADALYNSSLVPHMTRWSLPLPTATIIQQGLATILEQCLDLLRTAGDSDAALYFYRLVLMHEDMHHEAALYTAQALGISVDDPRWQAPGLPSPSAAIHVPSQSTRIGYSGNGFAFDNELGAHEAEVKAFDIDAQVLRWAEYLAFVEDGGYQDERWWLDNQDPSSERPVRPRYIRPLGSGRWEQWCHGQWRALNLSEPACHLTWFEAMAWCRWAKRRLPTEVEWETAATQGNSRFVWGAVWEWTASTFEPYPGFVAHPYEDYSAPWFGDRKVLRGASFMTQDRLAHPRYRNFFAPHRSDVAAGFRTCALP